MDKPYGKLAEFFYGRAACALAYSLRNRAERWESDTISDKPYYLQNSAAGLSLWIVNGRSCLRLETRANGEKLWSPRFFGSFLVWSAVKRWKETNEEKAIAPDDRILCMLALSDKE